MLAADGKGIPTHARPRPKAGEGPEPDGRRDLEADWGVKTKRKKRKDGTLYEQVTKWFGFERHFIRGLGKMRLRVGLALVVMLAMALGRIKQEQEDALRCLVRAA